MNKRNFIVIAAVTIALLIPTTAILITWAATTPPQPTPQQIAAATDQPPPQRGGWRSWWGRGRDNQDRPDDPNRPPRGDWRMGDGPPDGPPPFMRGPGRDAMMRRMGDMRRENPELAELYESMRRQDLKIREAIQNLPKEKLENPDSEVVATLQPLFDKKLDLDIKRQQIEIDLMQEKLDKLKMILEKKIEHKDKFIQMLIQRLPEQMKEERERGRGFHFWGGPPPGPPQDRSLDEEFMKENPTQNTGEGESPDEPQN